MNAIQTGYIEAKASYLFVEEAMRFQVEQRYPDIFALTDEEMVDYDLFVEGVDAELQVSAAWNVLNEAEAKLLAWAKETALALPMSCKVKYDLEYLFSKLATFATARQKVIDLALRLR